MCPPVLVPCNHTSCYWDDGRNHCFVHGDSSCRWSYKEHSNHMWLHIVQRRQSNQFCNAEDFIYKQAHLAWISCESSLSPAPSVAVWNKSGAGCFSFSHLQQSSLRSVSASLSPARPPPSLFFSPLLTLWCLWSLKPCQIEFVIISFSPWGQGYSYCLCVRVRVGLRDVLSASIIQEVSASAAHVMLLGGWAGDGARGVRREGGDWRKDVADLFLVAFRAFPYSLLHHFVILCR